MKAVSPKLNPVPAAKVTVAGALEWAVLGLLLAALLFFFLRGNGFIDASDIQPYPY
jgi:hypothetical protein